MPFKMAIFKLQRVSLRRPRSHVRRTLIKKRHSAKREDEKKHGTPRLIDITATTQNSAHT